jgi:hypothetical protein
MLVRRLIQTEQAAISAIMSEKQNAKNCPELKRSFVV